MKQNHQETEAEHDFIPISFSTKISLFFSISFHILSFSFVDSTLTLPKYEAQLTLSDVLKIQMTAVNYHINVFFHAEAMLLEKQKRKQRILSSIKRN